jgi:voltage-gated potassium channel
MISTPLAITLIYGTLYSMMRKDEFGFKGVLDPFYFSFTTMSTVGYGDFSPKTNRAKMVVMSQQLTLIIGILVFIKFFARLK